jgi:hypothetical protein
MVVEKFLESKKWVTVYEWPPRRWERDDDDDSWLDDDDHWIDDDDDY